MFDDFVTIDAISALEWIDLFDSFEQYCACEFIELIATPDWIDVIA